MTEPAPITSTDERVITVAADGTANPGVPTNVANPKRTTLRSIVQALIALVPLVNGAAAAVLAYLTEQGVEAPAWVWLALNGAVAVTALVAGLVTRIMAVPGVEWWLQRNLPWLAALRSN